jgi:hypothetical protein
MILSGLIASSIINSVLGGQPGQAGLVGTLVEGFSDLIGGDATASNNGVKIDSVVQNISPEAVEGLKANLASESTKGSGKNLLAGETISDLNSIIQNLPVVETDKQVFKATNDKNANEDLNSDLQNNPQASVTILNTSSSISEGFKSAISENVNANAATQVDANAKNGNVISQAPAQAGVIDAGQQKIAENMGAAKDKRVLGKDTLESAVKGTENSFDEVANNFIKSDKKVSKSLFDRPETITDSKISHVPGEVKNFVNANKNTSEEVTQKFVVTNTQDYKVAKIVKSNGVIEIQLEPQNLGKVDVKFEFGNDGKTHLVVTADKKDTLDILQRDSAGFQKILNDNGIKADSGSLSFNLRGGNGEAAMSFSQSQHHNQNNNEQKISFLSFAENSDAAKAVDEIKSRASAYNNYVGDRLVNLVI